MTLGEMLDNAADGLNKNGKWIKRILIGYVVFMWAALIGWLVFK